jgi:hypothetical protein
LYTTVLQLQILHSAGCLRCFRDGLPCVHKQSWDVLEVVYLVYIIIVGMFWRLYTLCVFSRIEIVLEVVYLVYISRVGMFPEVVYLVCISGVEIVLEVVYLLYIY